MCFYYLRDSENQKEEEDEEGIIQAHVPSYDPVIKNAYRRTIIILYDLISGPDEEPPRGV